MELIHELHAMLPWVSVLYLANGGRSTAELERGLPPGVRVLGDQHRGGIARGGRVAAAGVLSVKLGRHGASGGAIPGLTNTDAQEKSPASTWDYGASDDSRGGTRTRDPGIMSAVL